MLFAQRAAMTALGKVLEAVVGVATAVSGLACTPTSPASMQVKIGAGQIMSLQNLDSTSYSSLPADTTHQIVKQGLLMDAVSLSCPAPGTTGQSINYLIEATFQETDGGSTVLPYFNSAIPTEPFSGPGNSGTPNYTQRLDQCVLQVKAGTAATTGSQTTPAPDSGYVGLYVVTVANGQTTITSGNISTYAGAPFLPGFARLDGSAAFTGPQAGVTASQFDDSTKLATTDFVKRQGLQFTTFYSFSSNQTLTAAHAGAIIDLSTSTGPTTFTLPASATFPPGGTLTFYNGTGNALTIQRAGSDIIYVNSSTVTSMTLGNGDTLILTQSGPGSWVAVAGSAQLKYAAVFANSLTGTTGYQQLPSGKIEQWGLSAASVGGSTVTFPLPFPNGCKCVMATSTASSVTVSVNATTATTFSLLNSSGTGPHYWLAIGY